MLDDLCDECFVLRLRVLLIENAVLLVLETTTPKAIAAGGAECAIELITARPAARREKYCVCVIDAVTGLVHIFRFTALLGIHAIF